MDFCLPSTPLSPILNDCSLSTWFLSNKRMQFDMISLVLTELKVFSINISKQKPSTMSGVKCIQIIKGLFLFKILFSKGFFHKMRENPKAILLPRSSHPVRDSYLLIARPEGCWPLELGVVKHGAHGSISKFVNAYLSTQVHLEGKI